MSAGKLPPCGIYRTLRPIGDAVPAGRLVYFHNHGDPGPGVYLPERWEHNRARFHDRGHVLPDPDLASELLEPLRPEGFYRIGEPFHCCGKKCRRFERDLLVQLGYDGAGAPLMFLPELGPSGLVIPSMGKRVEPETLENLLPLKVESARTGRPEKPGAENLH